MVFAGNKEDGVQHCCAWKNVTRIATSDHFIFGLNASGDVLAVGDMDKFNVDDWFDVVAVSANSHNTMGLKADGTVVIAGAYGTGEIREAGWQNISAISCGERYLVGLKDNGRVVVIDSQRDEDDEEDTEDVVDEFGKRTHFSRWTNIVAVSSGESHIVGLTSYGTVVAYAGFAYDNRCNVDSWRNIVEIAAGDDYTMGLTVNGDVVVAGDMDAERHECNGWKLP